MDKETYDNVAVVQYRHPSEFFHRNSEGERIPVCCTLRKCGLCMLTLVICMGGGFLGKYLIDNWDKLEGIS
jgi:hypothetical protein